MVQDSELLRRYVEEGSQEAFAAIVDRYIGLLYRTATRRLANSQSADDVVQSTFIDLARKARSLRSRPVLAGWLYSTISYECLNLIRQNERRRRREQEALLMDEQTRADTPEESWGKIAPLIDIALNTLSPGDREAVLLRFFCQLPFFEIGRQLNATEEAARKKVDRALVRLRQSLEKKGVSSTASALSEVLAQQPMLAVPVGLSAQVSSAAYLIGFNSTVGTSTSAKLFTVIMKTKSVSLAAVVFGLIATGLSVFEATSLHRAEQDLVALGRELQATKTQLVAAEKADHDVRQSGGQAATSTNERAEKATKSSEGGDLPSSESDHHSQGIVNQYPTTEPSSNDEIILGDPTYAELAMKELTAGLPAVYAPLYRKLRLTAEQQKEFEEIMIEKRRSLFDGAQAAKKAGISVDDPSLSALQDDMDLTVSKRLIALLGPRGVDALSAFESLNAGEKIVTLAGNLYSSAHPLQPEQGDALLQLFSSHTVRENTPAGLGGRPVKLDNEAVLAEAGSFLSPDQFEILRSMILKSVYGQEANDRALYLLKTSAVPGKSRSSAASTKDKVEPRSE